VRIIKIVFLALVAIVLAVVGFANRAPVTLRLFPDELVPFTGVNLEVTVRLYVVVFAAIAVGVLLGFVWEWLREARFRAEATRERRERARLSAEVAKLKSDHRPEGKEEILALVEKRKPAA